MGNIMSKNYNTDDRLKNMSLKELVEDMKRSAKVLSSDDLQKKRNAMYSYFI